MNKTIEKILKKIEEKRNKYQELADSSNFDGWNKEDIYYSAKAEMCEELKEIVQEVAKEYKNGWIPCSEMLPDDFMSFEYLTIRKNHTLATITYYCVVNHKWYLSRNSSKEIEVIAWQPLPEPFKERDKIE